ncbi:MAG: ABC transporter permease [Oscillospiraceae bacterium]|nr:ABC transporter permease [Oscillospiraceae bacterium]
MKYIGKRFITLIITLLCISAITFAAFSVIPGNASITKLGTDAAPEQIAALEKELGLDQPVTTRYFNWLKDALRGDFGDSYQYDNTTVTSLLASRLPVTVLLAVMAFLLIILVSIPLGILSARFSGKLPDTLINVITQITMAIPPFFLGILLTYIFGLVLKWFQPGQFISPKESFWGCVCYLIFPAVAVALPKIAMVVKFLRNSVLGQMGQDYVRTAYSRGNTKSSVLYRHVLKNAFIPVITFMALIIAEILAGSIIVEQVFSVPGVGRLLITAISSRDYPVVQAIVTYVTALVVTINFLVDVLYQVIDPRIRTAG